MARDLDILKSAGVLFKKGKDETGVAKRGLNTSSRKPKGKTISGAAKMKAAYRTRKS